ncbi:hypothetical protein GGF46_002105 [Coemansia sp. RSA 552]|nr:hypothetical protein GGF46_002105 [Coemansia sp. RSA 552]
MVMYGVSGQGNRPFQADPLDLSQASLTLFSYPYCGKMYYGTWADGQKVVVKTAAAIRRLEALQGDIISRYITHGYTTFEGDAVAALVVEQVSDGPMLMAEEMDVRPELAMLSKGDRKLCVDALDRIHEHGVVLNDIHGAYLVFRPGGHGEAVKPVFVNFEYAEEHWEGVPSCDRAADYSSLKNVFNGA